jgi:hypothetical protein
MKPLRFLLSAALISVSAVALAQSAEPAPQSAAQVSFATLKSLAGEWEGRVTVVPDVFKMSEDQGHLHVSLRVTSRGHALVHELQQANTPLDPTKYDHPVTMLYLDDDGLNLVHYCDAGNRPHMVAKPSADGTSVEFELVSVSGSLANGHMDHAIFTPVDADHHTEDWTYMLPGDKPVHAHFDLHRISGSPQTSW